MFDRIGQEIANEQFLLIGNVSNQTQLDQMNSCNDPKNTMNSHYSICRNKQVGNQLKCEASL